MPLILILIHDPALQEAIIEQIAAAKLCEFFVAKDAGDLGALPPSSVVIVDDVAFSASGLVLPEDVVLLLLGDPENTESATETFPKPFRLGHLVSRVQFYLETAPLLRNRPVEFGPYRLEPQSRHVVRQGADDPIRLTEKETALLVFLHGKEDGASRQEILAFVWGYDDRIDTRTLETHIYQLRRKLDVDGEEWILNEAGVYRLARSALS